MRILVALKPLPLLHSLVKGLSCRSIRSSFNIVEGSLVRRYKASPCSHLYTHIADGHPLLHTHCSEGAAAILHKGSVAAGGAKLGDYIENNILGTDTWRKPAINLNLCLARLVLQQRLRCKDHCHLACTYAKCNIAKSAVGSCMTVSAYNRLAAEHHAALRTAYMHNAVAGVSQWEIFYAKLLCICRQLRNSLCRGGLLYRQLLVQGRSVVVAGCKGHIRPSHPQPLLFNCQKGLRRGNLVNKMPVYIEQRGPILNLFYYVGLPNLIKECLSHN